MVMKTTRREKAMEPERSSSIATLERSDYPAKRIRREARTRTVAKAAHGEVESLDGVIHEWVRQYQPELFEQIQQKEAQLKHLATQLEAVIDLAFQEALRFRLEAEKRELVSLVWDAIASFDGKPLMDPLTQGYQLGLLIQVSDPAGRIYYVPRGLLHYYLKEGYEIVPPTPPAE